MKLCKRCMEEVGWFIFSVEPIHMATMNPVPEYWKKNLVDEKECEFWAHKALRNRIELDKDMAEEMDS